MKVHAGQLDDLVAEPLRPQPGAREDEPAGADAQVGDGCRGNDMDGTKRATLDELDKAGQRGDGAGEQPSECDDARGPARSKQE